MSWSIKIGKIAGTELRIHVTFLLLLAWLGLAYYWQGGADAALSGVGLIVAIFGCVLLHELGHALAARAFGIRTPDITLLPIGGVARLQRIPEHPLQEIVVALAGPAVNVLIALGLFAALGRLVDPMQAEHLRQLDDPRISGLAKLATVNVWMVLFNLLPAFPMDGGRVLRAVLAVFMRHARATQIAARVGQGMAFLFGLAGLFGNPMLLFIALFIYLGATQEAAVAEIKEIAHNLSVADAMVTNFVTLDDRATLADAVEALLRTSQHEFPVLDGRGQLAGILTRDDMIAAFRRNGPTQPVTEVMHRRVPSVVADAPFDEAFRRMQECECPALAAVDGGGRVIGLVTPENIGEMMMVHSVLPKGGVPSWRTAR
ncbi:MAG: site-2 protease family protein [Verrucomicrobia bacterium]|nr:site-2 protease family protein [Verrucomicrobiota bacterium]